MTDETEATAEEVSLGDAVAAAFDQDAVAQAGGDDDVASGDVVGDVGEQGTLPLAGDGDPAPGDTPTEAEQTPAETDGLAAPEPGEAISAETPAETPVEPARSRHTIPSSWRKSVIGDKWDTLPEEVQTEIIRREDDNRRAYEKHQPLIETGRDFETVVQPYLAQIQAEGGNPLGAVRDLLNTAYQLRTAPAPQKAQMVAGLIQQFGVDISQLDQALGNLYGQNGQPPTPPAHDPRVDQLIAQNQQMLARQNEIQQSAAQQIQDEVNAFAADPKHPYFEEVREDMVIFTNQGLTLEEAYDRACYANPDVRQRIMADQAQAQSTARATAAKQAAERAKSVPSGGPAMGGNSHQPGKNLRDDIAHAWDQQAQ